MKIWSIHSEDVVEVNRRICLRDQHQHQCYGVEKVDSALHSTFYPGEYPYEHSGVGSIAGAMAYYLTQSHAFFDGNKRTAATCALIFLRQNGWNVKYPRSPIDTLAKVIEGCARGKTSKKEMMEWFDRHKIQDVFT